MKGAGPRAWCFFVFVRVVIAVMQIFPLSWNLRTARLLSRIWPLLMSRHRERAETHLAAAFPHLNDAREIRRLSRRCLEAITMFAVEALCLPRLVNRSTWGRYVRLVDFEPLLSLMLGGRGVIMVTGHYGSFELIGHLVSCLGFRIAAVMRPLDNIYLNRFVVESRRTHGLYLIDKRGAMENAESMLRDGWLLGFIGDQDAGRKGVFVDFFGQSASTYKSIGLLAVSTDTPVVVGYARRDGNEAHYTVGVQRIIRPEEWADQADPVRWITAEFTRAIEQFVMVAPEQYLWIHRRWKSRPRRSPG